MYNLPSGAKNLVEDGETIEVGSVLAESMLVSEYGGEVRIPDSLKTETVKMDGDTINRVVDGKEITIVIAALNAANADLQQTKKELLWKVKSKKKSETETYVIKCPGGTMIENGSIIAELVDDSLSTQTSGVVRYHDLEVDGQRLVTKPGTVYFIPKRFIRSVKIVRCAWKALSPANL